ncbi:cache domain-containing protein [Marinomonas sp. GJ51-6]|uniref:cache domain-containing protein n=1 Tax=Marinomonas sp. GJ51-6 TaxID=2992802 RepID=UPI002934E242|nr:cache domain-containing protein [Marinomonas sp. GJ51-6]WOD06653.1 cache domain-containing protein [Marinomonas sp. GJ51-6]
MFRSLKAQIYMFAFAPFLLVAAVGVFMQIKTLDTINQQVSKISEDTIIEVEKRRLVTVIDSSLSIIKPYLDMPGKEGMEDALALLYNYRFDNDIGYLFAYDGEGNRIMSGSGVGVGGNFIDSKDKLGNFIVRNILTAAKSGEGFTTYYFPKKGETEPSAKYSYSLWIDKWNVAIATGFFIDGTEDMLSNIDNSLKEAEQSSLTRNLLVIFGLAVFVAIVVFFSVRLMLTALVSLRDAVEDLADGEGDLTATLPWKLLRYIR